jgi:peptidoglycan/xylan/chitin deacetylase (PgdA/CDA1 family)
LSPFYRRRRLLVAGAATLAVALFTVGAAASSTKTHERRAHGHAAAAAPIGPVPMLPRTDRAAVWTSVPVDQAVAFITIDDGYERDNAAADLVQNNSIPVTPFLTYYAASSGAYPPSTDPAKVAHVEYLRRFAPAGRGVQSHAKSHAHLTALDYAGQESQIRLGKTWLARTDMFGPPAPTLFRPPYGEYNDDTLKAAWANGFPVVVLWTHTPAQLQAGATVHAGDIILLHFTTTLTADLQLALSAIASAGLTPAYLADYVR